MIKDTEESKRNIGKSGEDQTDANSVELIPSQLSAKIEEQARNLALNDASEENSSSSSSMFNLPKSLRMKEKYFKIEVENHTSQPDEYIYFHENSTNVNNQMMREIDEIAELIEEKSDSQNSSSLSQQQQQAHTNYSLFRTAQPTQSYVVSSNLLPQGLNLPRLDYNQVSQVSQERIQILSPSQILLPDTKNLNNVNVEREHGYEGFNHGSQECVERVLSGHNFNNNQSSPLPLLQPQNFSHHKIEHFYDKQAHQIPIKVQKSEMDHIFDERFDKVTSLDTKIDRKIVSNDQMHTEMLNFLQKIDANKLKEDQTNHEIQKKNKLNIEGEADLNIELNDLLDFQSNSSGLEDKGHRRSGSSSSGSSIDHNSPRNSQPITMARDEEVSHQYSGHKQMMNERDIDQQAEMEEEREDGSKEQYFQNLIERAHAVISSQKYDSPKNGNQDVDDKKVELEKADDFSHQDSTIQQMIRALDESDIFSPKNIEENLTQEVKCLNENSFRNQQCIPLQNTGVIGKQIDLQNQVPQFRHAYIKQQHYPQAAGLPFPLNQEIIPNIRHQSSDLQTSSRFYGQQEQFQIYGEAAMRQGQYEQMNFHTQHHVPIQGDMQQNNQEFKIPEMPSRYVQRDAAYFPEPKKIAQIGDQRMQQKGIKEERTGDVPIPKVDDQQQRMLISGFAGIDLTMATSRKASNEIMRNPSSSSLKQQYERFDGEDPQDKEADKSMESSSNNFNSSYKAYNDSIQRRVTPLAGQLTTILNNLPQHQNFTSGNKLNDNNPQTSNKILQQKFEAVTGVSQLNSEGAANDESILEKAMSAYDEAQTQTQKLEALRGGVVVKLALSQAGSKFLQKVLENANPQIVQYLLNEITPMLPEIMVDNYGNYFCQKLLSNCSADQRMQILERIADDIVKISCDKRGTHTIQTFIDLVNLEKEIKYFQRVLNGHVADLSLDVQGTHVIQILVKCFEEPQRQFVFDEVFDRFVELSMNNHGLCVVKLVVAKTTLQENRVRLMQKLVAHAIELAQNPYGNYAIQQAFQFWDEEICQDIIPQFFGKVYQLSMQKCSSNVIDRSIQKAKPEYLCKILQELIKCDRLNNLIMNQYGNFVVQNALKFANHEDRPRLAEQIEKIVPTITDQKIKIKWVQLLKKAAQGHFNQNSAAKGCAMMSTSSRGNHSQRGGGSAENSAERSETSSLNKRSIFSQVSSQTTKTSLSSHIDARNFHQQQFPGGMGGNMVMMPPPPKRVQSGIYVPSNHNFGLPMTNQHSQMLPNGQQAPPQYQGPNGGAYGSQFNQGYPNMQPYQMNFGYQNQNIPNHPSYQGMIPPHGQTFQRPPQGPSSKNLPFIQGQYPQQQQFFNPQMQPQGIVQQQYNQNYQSQFSTQGPPPFQHHPQMISGGPMQNGQPYYGQPGAHHQFGQPPGYPSQPGGMMGQFGAQQQFQQQQQPQMIPQGGNYDPLNIGSMNMAANNMSGVSLNSNIKRAVSDNVQFYSQGHFVKANQNNVQGGGYPQQTQMQPPYFNHNSNQ